CLDSGRSLYQEADGRAPYGRETTLRGRHPACCACVGGGSMTSTLERDITASGARRVGRAIGDTPRRLKLLAAGLTALCVLLGIVYVLALSSDTASFSSLQARTAEVSATGD